MFIKKYKQNEINRLSFIKERDGYIASVEFAKRGLLTYRKHLFTKAGREFRIPLLCSCVVYKIIFKGVCYG